VVVLDNAEMAGDLARDLTEVLTWMCGRRYGRRCASRRARAAVVAIESISENDAP
jgi:putative resolvase